MKSLIIGSLAAVCFANTLENTLESSAFLTAANPVKNIDYLVQGYNIYKGNPLDNTVDKGFQGDRIFKIEYDKPPAVNGDKTIQIPKGLNIDRRDDCQLDFTSKKVTGEKSYSDTLKLSLSVSGGFAGASFSASTEWEQVKEETQTQNKINTIATGTCSKYYAELQLNKPPALTQGFIDAVKALPEAYNGQKYFNFINQWGTHFVTEITMGGRYTVISSLSAEEYKTLEQQGISVAVGAKYAAQFEVGGKASTSTENKKAQQFNNVVKNKKQYTIGSTPPKDGKLETWASNSVKNPMPIKYSLNSMDMIFVPKYFGLGAAGSSNQASLQSAGITKDKLTKIKANMAKALNNYCPNFLKPKANPTCAAPKADVAPPNVPNSCRFCAKSCGGTYAKDNGGMSVDIDWRDFFYDYAPMCRTGYAQNEIGANQGGVRLCCGEETETVKGTCKICTSCGGSFPHNQGSIFNDRSEKSWISAFSDQCLGEATQRPNTANGFKMCCSVPDMCSMCMTCGGDYPIETGQIGVGRTGSGWWNNWSGFFSSRGKQCAGNVVDKPAYEDAVRLCCKANPENIW